MSINTIIRISKAICNIWFDATHIEAWLGDPNVSRVQGGTKVLSLY